MSADALHRWTARETRDAVRGGKASVTEVVQALLARIARLDRARDGAPGLGAFLRVDEERVLARAAALDRDRGARAGGALFGVPVAVKDNLCTQGLATTAASRMRTMRPLRSRITFCAFTSRCSSPDECTAASASQTSAPNSAASRAEKRPCCWMISSNVAPWISSIQRPAKPAERAAP